MATSPSQGIETIERFGISSEVRFIGLLMRVKELQSEYASDLGPLELGFQEPHHDKLFLDEGEDAGIMRSNHILTVETSKTGVSILTHRTLDRDYSYEIAPPETIVKGAFIISESSGNFLLGASSDSSIDRWSEMLERGLDMYDKGLLPPRQAEIAKGITLFQAINSLIPMADPREQSKTDGCFDIEFLHKDGKTVHVSDTPISELTGQRGIQLEYSCSEDGIHLLRRISLKPVQLENGEIRPVLNATDHIAPDRYQYEEALLSPFPSPPLRRGEVTKLNEILYALFVSNETRVKFSDGQYQELGSLAEEYNDGSEELEMFEQLTDEALASPLQRINFITAAELKVGPQLWGQDDGTAKGSQGANGVYESSDGLVKVIAHHPLFLQIEISDDENPPRLFRTNGTRVFEFSEDSANPSTEFTRPNVITAELFRLYQTHYPQVVASFFISGMKQATSLNLARAYERLVLAKT